MNLIFRRMICLAQTNRDSRSMGGGQKSAGGGVESPRNLRAIHVNISKAAADRSISFDRAHTFQVRYFRWCSLVREEGKKIAKMSEMETKKRDGITGGRSGNDSVCQHRLT